MRVCFCFVGYLKFYFHNGGYITVFKAKEVAPIVSAYIEIVGTPTVDFTQVASSKKEESDDKKQIWRLE